MEVARVELLREDELEGDFKVLQFVARPPRRHGAAVLIVEADALRVQLDGVGARTYRDTGKAHAEPLRGRLHDGSCRSRRGNVEGARRVGLAVDGERRLEPVHVGVGFEQPIDDGKGVVLAVAEDKARSASGAGDGASHGLGEPVDLLKGAIEAVQYTIELDAHLEGQCVAGVVVGALGRATGIGKVVGVVLRLEHIEDVRTEGLRRLDHIRTLGVALSLDRKVARGAHHGDAVVEQRIDELADGGGNPA